MRRSWVKSTVLLLALSVLALSSAWAWPSATLAKETVVPPLQEGQSEAVAVEEGISQEGKASILPTEAQSGISKGLEASLRDSLGDRTFERIKVELDAALEANTVQKAEYDELYAEYQALLAEYNALARNHADILGGGFNMTIVPEAVYDISSNSWGVGLGLGFHWSNLAVSLGAEKMFGDKFVSTEGFRVRAGVGIVL